MKKLTDKILSMSADAALEAIIAAAGLASIGGAYQPKEPAGIENLKEKSKWWLMFFQWVT